jgi:hypothetical protein
LPCQHRTTFGFGHLEGRLVTAVVSVYLVSNNLTLDELREFGFHTARYFLPNDREDVWDLWICLLRAE